MKRFNKNENYLKKKLTKKAKSFEKKMKNF